MASARTAEGTASGNNRPALTREGEMTRRLPKFARLWGAFSGTSLLALGSGLAQGQEAFLPEPAERPAATRLSIWPSPDVLALAQAAQPAQPAQPEAKEAKQADQQADQNAFGNQQPGDNQQGTGQASLSAPNMIG